MLLILENRLKVKSATLPVRVRYMYVPAYVANSNCPGFTAVFVSGSLVVVT